MKDVNIELRRWWVDELSEITRRVIAEEERRQARERKRAEKLMGEYEGWTYNDLQEAYGCGAITEKKYDRLVRLLENSQPVESDLYRAKVALLAELYQEQKEILDKAEQWEAIHNGETRET